MGGLPEFGGECVEQGLHARAVEAPVLVEEGKAEELVAEHIAATLEAVRQSHACERGQCAVDRRLRGLDALRQLIQAQTLRGLRELHQYRQDTFRADGTLICFCHRTPC